MFQTIVTLFNRILFSFALQPLNKVLYGGSYCVKHWDTSTGTFKAFWCDTWQDAMEWVSCALNDDRVTVTDTTGFVLAVRERESKD